MKLYAGGLTAMTCRTLVDKALASGLLKRCGAIIPVDFSERAGVDRPCNIRNMDAMIRSREAGRSLRRTGTVDPSLAALRARDLNLDLAEYYKRLDDARRRLKRGEKVRPGWV